MKPLTISYSTYRLLKFLKSEDDFRLLILGQIKSGKSAFMYHLAELFHKLYPKKEIFVVNFPEEFSDLLPSWIKTINRYEISDVNDVLLLFEESVLVAPSRSWYTSFNKRLVQLVSLSAHKKQRHIYVIQNARLLDSLVISLMSALGIKRYNYINYLMERKEIKELVSTAWIIYEESGIYSDLDIKRHIVLFEICDYPILYRYPLPSFWSEELSRVWHIYSFKIREKYKITETLTERVMEIMKTKDIKKPSDLYPYFPNANRRSLNVIFYRVKKRLAWGIT